MNPFDLVKNLQQAQEKMKAVQGKIAQISESGRAGGDMVVVAMDGSFRVINITIDPKAMDPTDPIFLQDLVTAACNDAYNKIKERIRIEVGSLTGDIPFLNQFMGG